MMTTNNATQPTRAYAAQQPGTIPQPWQYEPRQPRPDDVSIDILYCGVCHTDIHFVENDWGITVYPVVPGHEIIGRVTAVGSEVTRFKAGDMVGVGCLVDSCRECSSCTQGLEQYCVNGAVFTYNGIDRRDGKMTYGGYSERILVSERFVVHLPDRLDPASAAPSCVQALRPTRRCAMSEFSPAMPSGWSAWAAWGIWESSSPRPWAPR